MSNVSYYTKEGLEKLKKELERLEGSERQKISQQIADARDKGDLSENAEYDAAKEAQGLLELRISQMKEIISNARILDESQIDTSRVQILSRVKIRNEKTKKMMEYTIVSESEADLKAGKISIKSPIAQGLLGKTVGAKIEVEVPSGKMTISIISISR